MVLRRYKFRRFRRRPRRLGLRARMAVRRRAAVRRRVRAFRIRRPRRYTFKRRLGLGREVKVNETWTLGYEVVWAHDGLQGGVGHGYLKRLSLSNLDPEGATGNIFLGGTGNGRVTGKSFYLRGIELTIKYLLANIAALDTLTGKNTYPQLDFVVCSPRGEAAMATIPDDCYSWPGYWKYFRDYRGISDSLDNVPWYARDKIKPQTPKIKIWKKGRLMCHEGGTYMDHSTPINHYMTSHIRQKRVWVPVNRRIFFREDQIEAATGNINATTGSAVPITQDFFLFMTSMKEWADAETYLIPYVNVICKWYYSDDA